MGKRKYRDLREHLEILEQRGLLVRVTREINKDTELHPLVRWQITDNRSNRWSVIGVLNKL